MSMIKEVAVRKAITILSSIGAQFKIIDDEGKEYGELQAIKIKEPRKQYKALYVDQMQALKVGDVATFTAPDNQSAEGMRTAAQAWAIQRWGKGSTITARKASTVEILRVS